ncbi:MAG TPA: hypothetical protein VHD32_09100 [Candidatus Didemnitutus sp.]|nr:hypothetical protein [Candidatus Didemnitutus sp.]
MGLPKGDVRVGNREILYYDRGTVELRDGSVARADILSDADFATFTARKNAEEARLAAERSRLVSEGESLKARKLSDGAFASTPFAYQVAYWQNFAARYPGVSVADEIALARARLAEQLSQQAATEERLANLEQRMDDAETPATQSPYRYGYGYSGYGLYSGYVDSPYRHHRDRDDNSGDHHRSSRQNNSSSTPDYNPYRWNPSFNDQSGNSHNGVYNFPTFPFAPLNSAPVSTPSRRGRF